MSIELKPCPLCESPVKWCGENEANPEDNHLCHHIQCTNSECRADFDFILSDEEMLPDDTSCMTAEECLLPLRIECAKRYNNRSNQNGEQ